MDGKFLNCQTEMAIENYLLTKIDSQQFQADTKIPSENELSHLFGVNRHIVRKAIERLCKLGRIYTVQGKGCFVCQKPSTIMYPIISQSCFSDNMNRRGKLHYSTLLNWIKTNPSREERNYLHLAEAEPIYRLEILRFVDQLPLSIYTSALPEKRVPELEKHLADFSSLYKILREVYGIHPHGKQQSIEATYPTLTDIEKLKITEHISILRIKSLAVQPDGTPIEFVKSRIRGDRYQLRINFRT